MAKKGRKADGGEGAGEDPSSVLVDERSEDATHTSEPTTAQATDRTEGTVSLGKSDNRAHTDETEAIADPVDTDDVDTDDADPVDTDDTGTDDDETVDTDDDETVDTDDDETVDTDDEVGDVDDLDDDLDDDDLDDDDLDDDDDVADGVSRGAFFATLGVAVVAVLGVLFMVGAYIWPAFLGPGAPDDIANRSISALSSKDQAQISSVVCIKRDGTPSASFPPELLALIGNVTGTGPATQTLDTEARVPIDLTLTQGGQSQTLPADLLFGVNDGDWCLNGISQRQ